MDNTERRSDIKRKIELEQFEENVKNKCLEIERRKNAGESLRSILTSMKLL